MDPALRQDISRKYRILNRRRNEINKKRTLIQRIGRGFIVRRRIQNELRNARRSNLPRMFCINPYDVTLDLRNKDDRKIYLDGCKGLDKEDLFDGSKEKYKDFVKLMK